jgi:hypothetical protein
VKRTDFEDLQARVAVWTRACFGDAHLRDLRVRGMRLLEEAIEFAQSVGVSKDKSSELLNYVYNRPIGEPIQELGGVAVTFLAAATALNQSATGVADLEITRVESKSTTHFAKRNQEKCAAGFGVQQ